MAFFSTLFGSIFAVFLSIFASKNLIKNKYVVSFCRRTMDILRSFPEIVIAMIFLYLMGKSEIPAVIAIVIHTSGALGKLFSEAIENVDFKPIEGLESCGSSWFLRIRFAVLPQVLPLFISYSLLRLEMEFHCLECCQSTSEVQFLLPLRKQRTAILCFFILEKSVD